MSSSQSLTTLDMRGFHSLLAVWAMHLTVLRRWFADAVSAAAPGRTTEPGLVPVWCDAFLRMGQPFGAGGESACHARVSHKDRYGRSRSERRMCIGVQQQAASSTGSISPQGVEQRLNLAWTTTAALRWLNYQTLLIASAIGGSWPSVMWHLAGWHRRECPLPGSYWAVRWNLRASLFVAAAAPTGTRRAASPGERTVPTCIEFFVIAQAPVQSPADANPWTYMIVAVIAAGDGDGAVQAAGLSAEARRREDGPADPRKGRDAGRFPPQGGRSRGQGNGAAGKVAHRRAAQRSRGKSSSNANGNSKSSRTWSAQRGDQLQKQEKMVESNQRKLAEKLEDANRRQTELDNLLDIQRQTLHKLSGMRREEAKTHAARAARTASWPTSRGR